MQHFLFVYHKFDESITAFGLGFVCCREGSVVAHFWIVMSVPDSHVGKVTLERVTGSLENGLRWYGWLEKEETAFFDGYLLHLPSLSVSGESKRGAEGGTMCVCVCKTN